MKRNGLYTAMPQNKIGRIHAALVAFLMLGASANCETSKDVINYLTVKAEAGDPDAQTNLGVCYFDGDGVSKSTAKAFELFNKAAAQKHAIAQSNVGVCYFLGEGVTLNEENAVKWFQLASGQGNAIGQYNLAKCYREGIGVTVDMSKAVKLYELASEQDLKSAKCDLGICYTEGTGVEKNGSLGLRLLEASGSGYTDYRKVVSSTMTSVELAKVVAEADVNLPVPFEENGKWGFKKRSGELVMSPQFDYASSFLAGSAFVCKQGGYGYISAEGKFLGKELEDAPRLRDSATVLEILVRYSGLSKEALASMEKTVAGSGGDSATVLEFVKAGYRFKDVEVEVAK